MTKFTQGVWKIKNWSIFSFDKEICELKQVTFGLGLGGISKRDFEAEANAKLIAAAPELLEALENANNVLKMASLIDKSNTCSKAQIICENAIKKATE